MKKDIVNILIGDSIAYGLGDNKYFGWFNRLRLKNKDMLKEFYFNLSIPGESSNEIVKRFELEIRNRINDQDTFNIIFSFGIKDALKLKNNKEYLETFINNVLNIILISKKYTNNIYFLGLIDINLDIRTEYDIESINKINNELELICINNKINFINMKNVLDIDDLYDGLHPNEIGHEKICNYVFNELFNE